MLRLAWRIVFSVAYTAYITLNIYLRGRFSKHFGVRQAMPIRKRWARNLLYGAGLRVQTEGQPPDFPCILVCNHRSYLDPIIILRDVDGYPVSKAEVEDWPILGKGAKSSGILFLQREESGSRVATLRAIAGTIKSGFPIILFPEGTTSDLPGTLEFKRGAFQIAAKMGIPIVPAAIVFHDRLDHWVGEESFGSHAWRRFRKKNIYATLCYGSPIISKDTDDLLLRSREWIEDQIAYITKGTAKE